MPGPIPQVNIPEGESGGWRVKRFTVSKDDALLSAMSLRERMVKPGTYTGLYTPNGEVMMSDTPAEMRDHHQAFYAATGVCLVNGLGLGMIAAAMASKSHVEKVFVVEKSPDVIKLVAPHMPPKVEVIEADAFTYEPPKGLRFCCVWHDIWLTISLDDQPERTRLMRKYGRKTNWQGCWGQEVLEREKRECRNRGWGWR